MNSYYITIDSFILLDKSKLIILAISIVLPKPLRASLHTLYICAMFTTPATVGMQFSPAE
jgi:hypothetical protein